MLGFFLLLIILFIVVQLVIHLLKNNWQGSLLQKVFPKPKPNSVWEKILSNKRFLEITASLVIGLTVALIIQFVHTLPVIVDIEDAGIDWVMKIRSGILSKENQGEQPRFVVLDVDDDTYSKWDYPLSTPRNYLKNLIENAVKGGAQLVIVDAELSQETPFRELRELGKGNKELEKLKEAANNFGKLHPFDQDLYDYINKYKETYCVHKTSEQQTQTGEQLQCVPIILVGPSLERRSMEMNPFSWKATNKVPWTVSRMGFLKDAVEHSKPFVQWASAFFLASPYDKVVRRWSLWQPVCMTGKENQPELIPSIELLAATWFKNDMLQNFEPKKFQNFQDTVFSKELKPFKPSKENCTNNNSEYNPPISDSINIGKLKVNTKQGVGQRIIYSMPWDDRKDNQPPKSGNKDEGKNDGVLEIFSAKPYAGKDMPISSLGKLRGKIVVIGGSHGYNEEQGDIYSTPLGKMLGGVILVNSIYSLLQFEVKGLGILEKLGIEAVLILLMSFMIAWIRFFWAMVGFCGLVSIITLLFYYNVSWFDTSMIMTGIVMVCFLMSMIAYVSPFTRLVFSGMVGIFLLLPLSIMWFGQGIWLDFAIPLIAVQFHKIADTFDGKENEKVEEGKKENSIIS